MTAFPKSRPRLLDQRDAKAARDAFDLAESAEAKRRANGRCEVFVVGEGRCTKRDTETHHLLGGWGRRGRGESAKAIRKQRCCAAHHKLITGHVLKLLPSGPVPRFDDPYEDIS